MADDAENLLNKTSSNNEPTVSFSKNESAKLKFPGDIENKSNDGTINIEPKYATKLIGVVSEMDPAIHRISYRVYQRRWIVLAVVALLNNSNTMSWIAFASISNYVDVFYGMNKAANWFSLVFIICTIPIGLFGIWMSSSFGLRFAILIAAWTNSIGATIRLISSFLPLQIRFPVGIFGQAVAACAYPFIMFLPPKVAGSWFPENQRALATTIGIMANPLGVLMANVLSPQIVEVPVDVLIINIITFVPCLLACLIATFCVTRSEPPMPPSQSAAQPQMPFFLGIKQCFTNKAYLLLLIAMGGGIGMFNCLYTVIQQLFCATGYSNSFSGLCAALMIIGGVFGASASGMFVDRTKLYEETMKVCMSLAVIFGVVFLQLSLHSDLIICLVIVAFLFGVFGLASYPVGLELASECTFPVSETTSSGLVVLCGQIYSIIFVAITNLFARPLQQTYKNIQVCTVEDEKNSTAVPQDSSISIIVLSIIATLLAVVLVMFFKPIYKRMKAEKNSSLVTNGKETSESRQLNDLNRVKDESLIPLAVQQSST
ncbi:Major Facilitator Superfamily protein [Brugia malayi]|uniref:Bm1803 n=1 Tax=Brugia malayi TaxID=6279 RepID=A0A0K0J367_BRUMA|nr:Major Facilitator Superfamily protein [Brugia malayi]CRZ23473.1 Bm1803 [Brugia malayi]VIO89515.1 Major Facilitator Superfamily protein [Brugia malayi]